MGMPAAIPADWSAIAALAASGHTLEDLSEQFGINFNTMKARCRRGGWKLAREVVQAERVERATDAKPTARNGVDVVAQTLAQRHKHTKLGLSMFTARAARVASKLPKKELLENAPAVKAVADIAGKVWPEETGGDHVALQFFSISVQPSEQAAVIDV